MRWLFDSFFALFSAFGLISFFWLLRGLTGRHLRGRTVYAVIPAHSDPAVTRRIIEHILWLRQTGSLDIKLVLTRGDTYDARLLAEQYGCLTTEPVDFTG